MKCRSIRVYRSIEPLTSQTTTSLRGFSLRRRVSRCMSSPPYRALCRSVRRTSSPGPRPASLRRVRRRPGSHCNEAMSCLACSISSGVNSAKSRVRQHLARAERAGEVDAVEALVRVGGFGGVVRLAARRGRPGGRPAVAALLAHRAQVHRRGAVLALTPEDVERLVEQREVVLAVHEQRPQRGAHVASAFEADVLQHTDGVQHPPDVYVEAEPPEQPSEEEEVAEDVAVRGVSHACPRAACRGASRGSAARASARRAPPARPRGTSA